MYMPTTGMYNNDRDIYIVADLSAVYPREAIDESSSHA